MPEVLVIIGADPGSSERALHALRMSVGIALAGNRTRVLLLEPAERLRRPAELPHPAGPRARELLDALAELGGAVLPPTGVLDAAASADVVIRWNP